MSFAVFATSFFKFESYRDSVVIDEKVMEKNIVDSTAETGVAGLDGAGFAGDLPGF